MKTPDRRQAKSGAGDQLHLIEPPPFSPKYPPRSSLAHAALCTLLSGQAITHPAFSHSTESWRLAAYIHVLRQLDWPVETIEIVCPTTDNPGRVIAQYVMPAWVIAEVGGPPRG
jgi:hypothetical protein